MTNIERTFGFTKKNGFIYLTGVRVQPFCALNQPAPNLSGKDQYSVTCEISEEQLKFLEGEMKKAAARIWKDKTETIYSRLDDKNKGARKFVIESNNTSYLGIKATRYATDSKGNPNKAPLIKHPAGDFINPGDYVVLFVTPVVYDFNGVRGVKFDFAAMKFQEKGAPLGGRKYADESDFEGFTSEDTEAPEEW